jgi:GTP pyrophosphokinase
LTELPVRRQRDSDVAEKGILIVGVGRLLTQLAGCCKPAPPDADRRLRHAWQGGLGSSR